MSLFQTEMSRGKGTNDRDGTRARVRGRDNVPVPPLADYVPECPPESSCRLQTLDEVSAVWDYDPSTGFLHWKIDNGRRRWPGKAVSVRTSGCYVVVIYQGYGYKAHRLGWLLHHRRWPQFEIDHINGNRADNRIVNLRDVPHQVNQMNQACHRAFPRLAPAMDSHTFTNPSRASAHFTQGA